MQNNCSKDNLEFAGFWVRFAAYLIDMAIVSAALLIVRLILSGVMSLLSGTFLDGGILFHYTLKDIILYMLQVSYFILLTYHTGTTLGKKALNLRVICADGEAGLGLLNVIYRETIGRFLSGIAFVGYIMTGLDKEKRGLHDILCDTRVIYAKKVKVYPVYQGTCSDSDEAAEENFVPQMVEDEVPAENQPLTYEYTTVQPQEYNRKAPEDIAEQWKNILNPQKDDIEGNS